ncbi:hypothetical protein GCM10027280_07070 [Micromonospora polyrhachis]|uniref:Type VII secretion protein EccE n=1 Tax=Micromonospora polyrhachis TaxID=1282883 RepID=A0A7W7SL19_9ACTN|nr:hypothetical protein [Micromonospora polyrhachis]MBB4956381.1 hypothetical protein [Micromonospora polyrhachis]
MSGSTKVDRTAGRFGAVQLVAIEATAMAGAAAYMLTPALGGIVVGTALLIAIGVLCRVRGRWVYETLGTRSRLVRRRRATRRAARQTAELAMRDTTPDPRLVAVAPGLTVTTVPHRSGAFGVGQDPLGWFAAVAVLPTPAVSGGGGVQIRPSRLAELAAEPALPASSIQLVVRHRPLPAATLHPESACAASYRELQEAAAQVPVHREVWLATRLNPRLADGSTAWSDQDQADWNRDTDAPPSIIGTHDAL